MQKLSGEVVSVLSVLSLLVGGLVHANMFAVGAAVLIVIASPLNRCSDKLENIYVEMLSISIQQLFPWPTHRQSTEHWFLNLFLREKNIW